MSGFRRIALRTLPIVGGLMGAAWAFVAYRRSQPTRFNYEGATYVRHPDGSFTSESNAPVISPQLEAVRAHWERSAPDWMKKR